LETGWPAGTKTGLSREVEGRGECSGAVARFVAGDVDSGGKQTAELSAGNPRVTRVVDGGERVVFALRQFENGAGSYSAFEVAVQIDKRVAVYTQPRWSRRRG
jgi:hypothetical protein